MSTSFFALFVVTSLVAVNALSIVPAEKPGTCSPFISRRPCIQGEVEKGACTYDVQCSGTQKCCPSACGRTCQKVCPAISEETCNLNCSRRGGLATDSNGCKVCACASCPPEEPIAYCFVVPCQFTKCPAHPNAQCISDYCGGCNANFFVNGRKVKCEIEEPPTLNCNLVDCAVPECAHTVVPLGECCPVCTEPPTAVLPTVSTSINCDAVRCIIPVCLGGVSPVIPLGQCCPRCPEPLDCTAVLCPERLCEEGSIPVTPIGQCCPVCRRLFFDPCALRQCAAPDCDNYITPPGECCPVCPRDCSLVRCARPQCDNTVITEGQCCPVCPPTTASPVTTPPMCSGAHEVYSECSGGACQSTCDHQVNCLVCSPGCACREGYVRETENGRCVREKRCPREPLPTPPVNCAAVFCIAVYCPGAVTPPGQCCPVCPKQAALLPLPVE